MNTSNEKRCRVLPEKEKVLQSSKNLKEECKNLENIMNIVQEIDKNTDQEVEKVRDSLSHMKALQNKLKAIQPSLSEIQMKLRGEMRNLESLCKVRCDANSSIGSNGDSVRLNEENLVVRDKEQVKDIIREITIDITNLFIKSNDNMGGIDCNNSGRNNMVTTLIKSCEQGCEHNTNLEKITTFECFVCRTGVSYQEGFQGHQNDTHGYKTGIGTKLEETGWEENDTRIETKENNTGTKWRWNNEWELRKFPECKNGQHIFWEQKGKQDDKRMLGVSHSCSILPKITKLVVDSSESAFNSQSSEDGKGGQNKDGSVNILSGEYGRVKEEIISDVQLKRNDQVMSQCKRKIVENYLSSSILSHEELSSNLIKLKASHLLAKNDDMEESRERLRQQAVIAERKKQDSKARIEFHGENNSVNILLHDLDEELKRATKFIELKESKGQRKGEYIESRHFTPTKSKSTRKVTFFNGHGEGASTKQSKYIGPLTSPSVHPVNPLMSSPSKKAIYKNNWVGGFEKSGLRIPGKHLGCAFINCQSTKHLSSNCDVNLKEGNVPLDIMNLCKISRVCVRCLRSLNYDRHNKTCHGAYKRRKDNKLIYSDCGDNMCKLILFNGKQININKRICIHARRIRNVEGRREDVLIVKETGEEETNKGLESRNKIQKEVKSLVGMIGGELVNDTLDSPMRESKNQIVDAFIEKIKNNYQIIDEDNIGKETEKITGNYEWQVKKEDVVIDLSFIDNEIGCVEV